MVFKCVLQPPPIAAVFSQLRLVDFNIHLPHGGIDFNHALGGRFADDLLLRPAFFGDGDQQVALHQGSTRHAHILNAEFVQQFGFAFRGRGDVVFGRPDGVLVKFPFFDAHQALIARLAAAANALKFDAQFPGGVQQRGAFFHEAVPPGRHENQFVCLSFLAAVRHGVTCFLGI